MGYKIKMTPEGVEALHQWADAISYTIDDIVLDTENLMKNYNCIGNGLGVHDDMFKQMMIHIKKAVQVSLEAVESLPEKLHTTADKMEAYIYNIPYEEGSSDSAWQRVRKR